MFDIDAFDNNNDEANDPQDYSKFIDYTVMIGELLTLLDVEENVDRQNFLMACMNILFMDIFDQINFDDDVMNHMSDFIIAICNHLVLAIQANPENKQYREKILPEIIPNLIKNIK